MLYNVYIDRGLIFEAEREIYDEKIYGYYYWGLFAV